MVRTPPSFARMAAMVGFTASCVGLLLYLWLTFGGSVPLRAEGYRFDVKFPEAAQLAQEADVRISGVNVGKVKKKIPYRQTGVSDVTIERNTALNAGSIILAEGTPHADVSFSGNIVRNNEYGIIGTGTGTGAQTLERYFPEAIVQNNAIVGGDMRNYPDGNFFPVSDTDVGFLDKDAGDLRLDPARKLRRGETNEVGADFDAMCAAFAPLERSRFCGSD